ncbi:protein FAM200B-like [Palaemon carinicauda]|uniref:protein FAM200B-like n=1 Tax=Palaemon carinicauda TaxID=392227 RepID=UPI0035B5E64A
MISYHCIIHQSVLCASLGDEYGEVMKTIMKLVNFLRSTSALQHRLLQTFLTKVNASYDDLLVHNNVRWLSKGKVLERFWAIRKELQTFLEDQNSVKTKAFSEFSKDDKKIESVGFLADIMSHLNDLSVKLQGEKHTISNLISAIRAFQKKLNFSRTIFRANFSIFQDFWRNVKMKQTLNMSNLLRS